MDCVHALLPYLQVSRRDGNALQPDARRDCVPSSPARTDAVVHQGPPAQWASTMGSLLVGGLVGAAASVADETIPEPGEPSAAGRQPQTSREGDDLGPYETRRSTIRQTRACMHVLVYDDIRCYRPYS
jgi:hypothetical protein